MERDRTIEGTTGMGGMEIHERAVGTITVLGPVGKLVLSEGQRDNVLTDTISGIMLQGRRQFMVDLAQVSYADTSGLAMLVAAHVTVIKRGGQIKLLHPTKRLRELFGVTRLNTVFEVFDSERDAIDSFTKESPPI